MRTLNNALQGFIFSEISARFDVKLTWYRFHNNTTVPTGSTLELLMENFDGIFLVEEVIRGKMRADWFLVFVDRIDLSTLIHACIDREYLMRLFGYKNVLFLLLGG